MPVKDLEQNNYDIPKPILNTLKSTLDGYNGDKTIDGYKRLNNLINRGFVTFYGLKRIKNYFDNEPNTKSIEYELNGGEPMKNWVNDTLEILRNNSKNSDKLSQETLSQINPKQRDTSGMKPGKNNVISNKPTIYGENISKKKYIMTESQFKNYLIKKILIENYESDKILYHGSNKEFDEFDENKISTGDSSDLLGKGFYLTDNIDIARFYAKHITKQEKVTKYTNTGIFGTEEPHFTSDADDHAEKNFKINKFKINGNILNVDEYEFDDNFKKLLIKSYAKIYNISDEYSYETINNIFSFLKINKEKIHNYRGELLYILYRLGNDKEIKEVIINYIKSLGYDGIKYRPDKEFEGNQDYWNYVIYNKSIITPLNN